MSSVTTSLTGLRAVDIAILIDGFDELVAQVDSTVSGPGSIESRDYDWDDLAAIQVRLQAAKRRTS